MNQNDWSHLTEYQARHLLEPLISPEEKHSLLKSLVMRLLMVPEDKVSIRPLVLQANGNVQIGSVLVALLPDVIFRAAVLDENYSVEQARMLYHAACRIVSPQSSSFPRFR